MESEVASNRPMMHPLTLWSINPRLQTRFDLDEGSGGADLDGGNDTTVSDNDQTVDTGVDDTQTVDSSGDDTVSTETDTDAVDPEEAARIEWQKEYAAATPRVKEMMIRQAERLRALEQEVERRQAQPPQQQPTVDPRAQDQELQHFLVENKRVYMAAQMRAINAEAAGNNAEYEKQLSIMAQADLNIGEISKERAEQAVIAKLHAAARPRELFEEIRSVDTFAPVHHAAGEIADVHAALERVLGFEKASQLMNRMVRAISAGNKPAKPKPSPQVTDLEQARAKARARSETPDGGVSGGGKDNMEKDMDAWVDRVLGLKKQRR